MAHRELTVLEVEEILRRFVQGESLKAIARATGMGRNTVRGWIRSAAGVGLQVGGSLATPEQIAAVAKTRRPPRKAEPTERDRALLGQVDRIRAWLHKDDLTLTKIQDLLAREGLVVPYSSLQRFARAHCSFGRRALTVRLPDPPPGIEAQVDFERLGYLPDPESGRARRLAYGFSLTLSYSRHQFLDIVFYQTVPTVIACFERAWAYFGGVVARVIPDNLKSVVTRADIYQPKLHPTFLEYSQHRGFLVDPARSGHPKDKPKVERGVPYARKSFFRGETFIDIDHCRRRALVWCTDKAGRRIHGTTRRRPLVVFEEEEKPHLQPISPVPFDPPTWGPAKVHPDHCVRFLQALYTVPTRFVGKIVQVRADSKLVRIYLGTEVVKTHPRQRRGGRSLDHEDYPKEKTPYTLRDPAYQVRKAKERGPHAGRFMERLLGCSFPWSKLRLAQKLLRLAETYGSGRLDAACKRALEYDLVDVFGVERILKQALDQDRPAVQRLFAFPLPGCFVREPGSFVHEQEVSDGSLV